MKIKTTFILLIISTFLYSQRPLDTIKQFNYKYHYELILNETKNEKSEYSYLKQLKKFTNNETQSNFEVLTLLIGFSDNENFKPYLDIFSVDKEIYDLNEDGKYQEAIEYGNRVLLKNPFMIKVLRELAYAYGKIGNTEMDKILMERTGKIYNAMFSSSSITGLNIKEPMFSLGPKDGQYFIKYFCKFKLGDMGSGYDENGYFIDILATTVQEKPATFYFNIDHVRKTMMKK
jgi:tetratricopeptide (TPR) repeat protein